MQILVLKKDGNVIAVRVDELIEQHGAAKIAHYSAEAMDYAEMAVDGLVDAGHDRRHCRRVLLVCQVVAGTVKKLMEPNPELTAAPSGYDSVIGLSVAQVEDEIAGLNIDHRYSAAQIKDFGQSFVHASAEEITVLMESFKMRAQVEAAGQEEVLGEDGDSDEDPMVKRAIEIIRSTKRASTSNLQRKLSIGYNRAARIMDELEDRGMIGPDNGSQGREILLDL